MTKKNGVNICKNVFVDLIKKILIVEEGIRKNMNLFNVFLIVSKYYQGFVIFTTS